MKEKIKYCMNGDGNLVCPPSKVICQICMDKIALTFEKIAKEPMTTGLLFGSNPFNCTIDNSSGLIIKGIYALDNLSDEIGVTHETVNGEIVEEEH